MNIDRSQTMPDDREDKRLTDDRCRICGRYVTEGEDPEFCDECEAWARSEEPEEGGHASE